MFQSREVGPRTIIEISKEWDRLAQLRFDQMSSGSDVTFSKIMLPTIFDLIAPLSPKSILDAGCGVGLLTNYLSRFFDEVHGVDPSINSVKIAERAFGDNCEFYNASLEDFVSFSKKRFDVITANMVLMDAPDALGFFQAAFQLLKPDGVLVFSMTHPSFWPRYYGYECEDWYSYNREIFIESPFRISQDQNGSLLSTHIHRPLEMYSRFISASKLNLETIREPFPNDKTQNLYPRAWEYPRYMICVCRKPRRIKLS